MEDRPTAVISGNDSIAFHFIGETARHGLACPRDFSIVGFDAEPAGRLSTPTFASYEQPLVEMGKTALDLLVEQINGEDWEKRTIEFPMRFVDGESLGTVPCG